MNRKTLALVASVMMTAACTGSDKPDAKAGTEIGIDLAGLNKSVQPGDDFDEYANGGWRNATEIPADRATLGSFDTITLEVEKRNEQLMADLLKAESAAGSDARKIADYHRAYADTATIERLGLQPLAPHFAAIDKVSDVPSLSRTIGGSIRADTDPLNATDFTTDNLFGAFFAQALSDPERNAAYLLQGGLGMPDRDYYLSSAAEMQGLRTKYRAYLVGMAKALGWNDAEARADKILALETKIARAHTPADKAQDPKAVEEWTRDQFKSRAPGMDWDAFFDAAQLGNQKSVLAWHPAPTAGLSALVANEPLPVWKDYLKLRLASRYAGVLPKAFDDLRFQFYGVALAGQQQQRPRDKRALTALNGALGDAVGRLYIEKYFPDSTRNDVGQMVDNIKAAFDRRLQRIDWLAPATKAEGRRKLDTLIVTIGGPEKARDFSALEVKPDDALGNAIRAEQDNYRHQAAKLGQPVDRREWWLLPHIVNAVFLPLQNTMNYPAAILEPPFYNAKADAAFNYGAIGSIIGHEITHSFDDLGADFDADGRLRNWWSAEDYKKFEAAGGALAKQYSAYEVFPGLNLNGKMTLGENIADVAGLAAAYDAYKASLNGKPAPVIDGLTGDQRFFLAYGQSRRAKVRDEVLRAAVATGVHAPGRWRAQTVRNIDGWYDAFKVQPGQKLYLPPDQRVRVWE